jgi:hypothetical protein
MDYLKYVTDHQRFSNYAIGRKLYLGQHSDVFKINQFEYFTNPKIDYLTYNYPEILTNNFSNLIWSEEPDIDLETAENQALISDWIISEQVLTALRECSETASYAGDAVVKLRVEDGKVWLEQVDNAIWHPIFDSSNPNKKAKGHILRFSKKKKDAVGDREYVLLEIHEPGQVQWEAYLKVQDKLVKIADPRTVFGEELNNVLWDEEGKFKLSTACQFPLVFHLKNNSISNEFFGLSDYTQSLIAKVYAINQNLNQIQYVLRKHAHPKMVLSKKAIQNASYEVLNNDVKATSLGFGNKAAAMTAFQNNGKDWFSSRVAERIINNAEYIGADDTSPKPEYLTWNGNLNESFNTITLLREALMQETQLAKVLVDPDMAMGSASGVAILRMAQPSLHKAEKKQAYLRDFIRQIVFTVQELSAKFGDYPELKAEYPDIKKGAIAEVKGIDDEKAQTEYEAIQSENDIFGGDNPATQTKTVL